jgi:hypothetical protein
MRNSLLAAATALALLLCGAAAAQDQSPQHTTDPPTELQGMPPDQPAVATVPEAATGRRGCASWIADEWTGPQCLQKDGCRDG